MLHTQLISSHHQPKFSATLRFKLEEPERNVLNAEGFFDRNKRISGQIDNNGDLLVVTNYPKGQDFDNLTAVENAVLEMQVPEKSEEAAPEYQLDEQANQDIAPELIQLANKVMNQLKTATSKARAMSTVQLSEHVKADFADVIEAFNHLEKTSSLEEITAALLRLSIPSSVPPEDELAVQLKAFLLAGQKIKGIKAIRLVKTSGLKETKEFYEALDKDMSLDEIQARIDDFTGVPSSTVQESAGRESSYNFNLRDKIWHDNPPSLEGLPEVLKNFLDKLENDLRNGHFSNHYDNSFDDWGMGSIQVD